jgi:hypothetical protein
MTENSSFLRTRHGATHEMQIDAADSVGGQRNNGVEIVPDGRPNDIVRSNACDPMKNDGFHNSFRRNSFSEIGWFKALSRQRDIS